MSPKTTPVGNPKKSFSISSSCSQGFGAKIKRVLTSHKTILTIAIAGLVIGGFALALTASSPAGIAMIVTGGVIGLVAAIRAFTNTHSIKPLVQQQDKETEETSEENKTDEASSDEKPSEDKTKMATQNEQSSKDEAKSKVETSE